MKWYFGGGVCVLQKSAKSYKIWNLSCKKNFEVGKSAAVPNKVLPLNYSVDFYSVYSITCVCQTLEASDTKEGS